MNSLKLTVLMLHVLMTSAAHARLSGVQINSINFTAPVTSSLPNKMLPLYLDISYDGSMGPITIKGDFKSKDGLVRTFSFGNDKSRVPVGQHIKIYSAFPLPLTKYGNKTDVFRAILQTPSGDVIGTIIFPYPYVWPDNVWNRPEGMPRTRADWINEHGPSASFQENFKEGDFAANDLLFDELLKYETNRLSGREPLWWVDVSIPHLLNDLELIKKWRTNTPKSPTAAILEAMYWWGVAWKILGNQYSPNTNLETIRLSNQKFKQAENLLVSAKHYASNNPIWYRCYLELASDEKRNDAFIEKLFMEAIRKYPRYENLYVEMAKHWTPANGDPNWEKFEKVVDLAVANTSDTEGTGVYAILYIQITANHIKGFEPFRDSPATWPKMKKALEDLILHHPEVGSFKNQYASFACRANDGQTFVSAWQKLGGDLNPHEWYDNYSADLCFKRFSRKT